MNSISETSKRPGFRGRPGNPQNCKKCLAKTRRGTPCQRPAEKNPVTGLRKRCRLHGGLCTGPSPEGRARLAAMHTIHGRYSKAVREAEKQLRERLAALKSKTETSK